MYIEKELMDQLCIKMGSKEKPLSSRQVHRNIDKKMKELGFTNKRISTIAISNFYFNINIRKFAANKELPVIEEKLKEIRDYELRKTQIEQTATKVKTITKKVPTKKKLIKYLDIKTFPSDFYKKIQDDINLAYTHKIYSAVLILVRKLIENLIISIMRKRYGYDKKENVELYFNTENKHFYNFNSILKKIEIKIKEKDFEVFPDLNIDLIKKIHKFREAGNKSAHTIMINLSKSKIDEYKENLEFIINVLVQTNHDLTT